MKRHVVRFMLIVTATFVLGVVSVNAQSSNGVKANVPFDFIVGDQTFQAGAITARTMLGPNGEPLLISSGDNRQHALCLTRSLDSTKSSENARLVFRKYGNRYYLAQVWTSGYSGSELFKSRSERALEREMRRVAKNASEPEMVAIIAAVD